MSDIKKIIFFTLVPVLLIAAAYTYSWVSQEKVQDINADYSETVKVPIIMYHGLIKDSSLQTEYFISPDRFEEDLKYIKAILLCLCPTLSTLSTKTSPCPKSLLCSPLTTDITITTATPIPCLKNTI